MEQQIDYDALAKQFGAKPVPAGQPDYDALAKQNGAVDAYQSIPNPTGQPLGADIPDDAGISIPGFAMEFGKEALRQGKEVATDPRTWFTALARRVPTVAAGMGGGEAVRQIGQHIGGSPDAPQTSGEAAGRIAKSVGVGVGTLGLFKGAAAGDKFLANRASKAAGKAAGEADLERTLLRKQEAGREEIIGVRDQATTETLSNKLRTASDRIVARKTMKQELEATKLAAEEAKKLANQTAASGGSKLAPTFGPAANVPKATTGLIERNKALVKGGIDDLYDEFRAAPESQEPFDMKDIKALATEIDAASAANPQPIVKQIINGPDSVPIFQAEDILSELKFASRIRAVGRTKSQGISARIQNELQPQIEGALKGGEALKALRAGRALRRHFGKTFEDEVAPGVARVLRQGGKPMQIVINPVKLKSFVEQAGDEGLPILRRKLFDDSFSKAVNPQTGEFSAEKFATDFNKYRHALTPDQQALGDSLARGNSAELAALDRATAQELTAVRNAHQDLNAAIGAESATKKAASTIKTRREVFESGKKTRADRLETRIKGEQMLDKWKRRGKMLLVGAAVAGSSGASLAAARMRALRSMFDVLSGNH